MSSPAQCLANAGNAKLSTGPKSAEGKAAVAKNSVRHGLFARYENLSPEHSARVDEYLELFHEGFPQQCDLYEYIIHQFAVANWRQENYYRMESAFFNAAVHQETQDPQSASRCEGADVTTILGYALIRDCKGPNVLAKLLRYKSQVSKELELARNAYGQVMGDITEEKNRAKPILPPQPEPALAEEPQPPRNAPCPCGSGIKYKRCCGMTAPAIVCTT